MSKPRVILAPHFRRIDEIFDHRSLQRLDDLSTIVWGRDDPMPVERFTEEIGHASAVVFGTWAFADALQHAGPQLAAVLEVAGGHHHPELGYERALGRGLHLGSCAPAFAQVVAEHALGLALTAVRGITVADQAMRRGDERWLHDGNAGNSTLFGATIGLIGFGGIARQLVDLTGPFGVTALAFDPHLDDAAVERGGATKSALDELIEQSDVVFVAAAPTDDNRGLVSRSVLERFHPEQTLVVISRASLVDFDAAVELAACGSFTLATDVFPEEPIPDDAAVRSAANTVLTPHIAGALPQALHAIGRMVVNDLESIFRGEAPASMQYLRAETVPSLVRFSNP